MSNTNNDNYDIDVTMDAESIRKQSKESTCSACANPSKVWDPVQRIMVAHFINAKSKNHMFLIGQEKEVSGSKDAQSVCIEVNFCPWCGRRLENGKD